MAFDPNAFLASPGLAMANSAMMNLEQLNNRQVNGLQNPVAVFQQQMAQQENQKRLNEQLMLRKARAAQTDKMSDLLYSQREIDLEKAQNPLYDLQRFAEGAGIQDLPLEDQIERYQTFQRGTQAQRAPAASIQEFQQWLQLNPDATPQQRSAAYNNILSPVKFLRDAAGGYLTGSGQTGGLAGSGGYTTDEAIGDAAALTSAETEARERTSNTVDAQAGLSAALSKGNRAVSLIDKAIKAPGREGFTGGSSVLNPVLAYPGSDRADFGVMLDQIKGNVFLEAYQDLKGGGAISDFEANKAEQALARLNNAQSDGAFLEALNDLKEVINTGMEEAKRKAGQTGSPSTPKATMRFNSETGKLEPIR